MNSSITLNDRESLTVTGVNSVDMITDGEVCVFTEKGDLVIKGSRLEAEKFDPSSGILRVNGHIDSFCYKTEKRHLPDNIIAKLFR
ncbi:MAG: hypothetical protein II820_04825 [Ruminiclostridium sp.]|nr:hypothetical protein [Ruminiclostridium sp.]